VKPTRLLYCLFIIGIFSTTFATAQVINDRGVTSNDAELWTGIDFEKELNRNTDFSFGQSYRLNNNFQRFKNTYSEVGLTFRLRSISKHLKINTSLRYIYDFDKDQVFRPLINISYRLVDQERVTVSIRTRIQKDVLRFTSDQFDHDFGIRERVMVVFKGYDVEPYLGAELFYRQAYFYSNFNQLRLLTGIRVKVTKRHQLKFGYIYREEFNVNSPLQSHIFTVGWGFEIKDLR